MLPQPQNSRDIYAASVTRWFDPFVSVLVIAGTYAALYTTQISTVHLSLIMVSAAGGWMFLSEYLQAPWSWNARPEQRLFDVLDRTLTKFLGVLAGITAILFAIWLFPEYDNARELSYLHQALLPFLAGIVPLSFILIFATEYLLGAKKDGTYQFGLLARFRVDEIEWNTFLDGALEWIVRCIFLLINFYSAVYLLGVLRSSGVPNFSESFVNSVVWIDGLLFTTILFAILPGYVFASRLINTEFKKLDRSWFGWAITLSCYAPLNAAVFGNWVRYVPSAETTSMLSGVPVWAHVASFEPALYAIGSIILVMALVHLWSEAHLGIRSSYLSSRGIITTGLFRVTKHPVYVSKCIQWGFMYLPFLNAIGFLGALQSGILFILTCVLFVGRALAEEKLLAEDPDYVAYALFMDTNSIFAFVGKVFPCMSFRWRHEYWKQNGYLPQ